MFTDFEYAGKRLSDFGWITCHIDNRPGVSELDIGCDITFNTVKNNHSSVHYVTSTSYDNVCTSQPFVIMKNPCSKNQEDMYAIRDEIRVLTRWLNRHEYRKFKPLYDSDEWADIHYYGSFNVKQKTIGDKIIGLVLTFTGNAPYGFGEQIVNEIDIDNNEVTVSGEFIHVEDSADSKIVNFSIQGNTEQRTTEGKNLWDKEFASDINNWILNEDNPYYKRVAVYVGKGRDVTLSYPTPPTGLENLYVCITLEDSYLSEYKTWIYNKNNDSLIATCVTLNASMDDYIYIWCLKDGIENGNFMNYIGENLQIEYGSEATEFEEYTGRKASPNMEYNQKVMHSGIYNEETGRYENKYKLFRKNFIPQTQKIVLPNFIVSNEGTHYGYSDYIEVPSNVTLITNTDCVVMHFDEKYLLLKDESYVQKFETLSNDKYIKIRTTDLTDVLGDDFELVLTLDGNELTHEAYEEQKITITSDRPITKWDKLVNRNGIWGWSINHINLIFDGSEPWTKTSIQYGCALMNIDYGLIYDANNYNLPEMFCDKLIYSSDETVLNSCRIFLNSPYGIRFTANGDVMPNDTIEEWKVCLSENPINVVYQSSEEQAFIPLPEEEQEAIRNIIMYSPITNFWNNQGMNMEVTYLQDYDNEIIICGDGDEYTTLYPNISITCKRDGDLKIKNTLTGEIFEVLNCSKDETIYVNGEHKYIDSDNKNHKETTLFNDFNYNYLDIKVTDNDFNENIYETSIPCKIVIDYSPIRKVGV